MELRRDGWYRADKGKHFVLTEKGQAEVAGYKYKIVGEPVSEYDTEAVRWSVESGYVIEVDIPDWVVKTGYEVVYDYMGYTLYAGNSMVFPERKLAENYMKHFQSFPWMDRELYIREATYEGRALKECREYNGKQVYNSDWYYGTACLETGDLVEKEIVDDIINCVPPTCMRSDCMQCGEPQSEKLNEVDGKWQLTYATFKQIDGGIYEFCGYCFAGENMEHEE